MTEIASTFASTFAKLESKIESFINNHEMVEDVIDNRLAEFRNAQKAAFEELEAALTLLERHQDETINRFKDKSQLGINKHINLPTSSKNRGSILHQRNEATTEEVSTSQSDILELDHKTNHKRNYKKVSSFSIALVLSLIGISFAIYYFVDFQRLSSLTGNFYK